MNRTTLELKNALKFFVSGREITLAVNRVSASFSTGEFVAITGESGGGKSTLAHLLAGVLPCNQGELLVNGQSTVQYGEKEWEEYRRNTVSFIAQNYGVLLGNTVWDNVMSSLVLAGLGKKEAKKRAKELLQKVDLWQFRHRRAAKLSSGQKQRLSVARAVAKPAPVLVADEPTSNLDWGTAKKIIALLHEAAKDRLVIVVTHNFETMREISTRHLVMKDGELIEDTVLTTEELKAEEKEAVKEKQEKAPVRQRAGAYIAGIQMKARPAWALFMLLFFSATALAVYIFLGNFLRVLDDTTIKSYSTEAYQNGIETRLVVVRQDKQPMTEEDYKKILAVPHIMEIERFGAISDINVHHQEDKDYVVKVVGEGDPMFGPLFYHEELVLLESDSFLRTVPRLSDSREFLKAGRMPEKFNEVVVQGSVSRIGETMTLYIRDIKKWAVGNYHNMEVTIVGVTDQGSGIYFSDRLARMFLHADQMAKIEQPEYYGIYEEKGFALDETIKKSFVFEQLYGNYKEYGTKEEVMYYALSRTTREREINYFLNRYLRDLSDPEVYSLKKGECNQTITDSRLLYYFELSEQDWDSIIYPLNDTQIDAYIESYPYTDRTIQALEELGYEAASPYRIGAIIEDDALEKERVATLVLSFAAVLVVIVAQIVVLASMFMLEMGDYEKLRTLGLVLKTGKRSVYAQVLPLALLGQVAAFGLFLLGVKQEIANFKPIADYIDLPNAALLCLVHFAASLMVAFTVGRILKARVFAFAAVRYDIDLSELEDETEGSRA